MNKLYKFFNELIGKNKKKILPEGDTEKNLANKFVKYFDEKIERIYSSFGDLNRRSHSLLPDFPFNSMRKFMPIDFSDLQNIVKKAKKTL